MTPLNKLKEAAIKEIAGRPNLEGTGADPKRQAEFNDQAGVSGLSAEVDAAKKRFAETGDLTKFNAETNRR